MVKPVEKPVMIKGKKKRKGREENGREWKGRVKGREEEGGKLENIYKNIILNCF